MTETRVQKETRRLIREIRRVQAVNSRNLQRIGALRKKLERQALKK